MTERYGDRNVGYSAFLAVAIFLFVTVVAYSANPSWDPSADSVLDMTGFEGFPGTVFQVGLLLAALSLAAFALKLASRKVCAMETVSGVLMLLVAVVTAGAVVVDASKGLEGVLLTVFVGSLLASMFALLLCSQLRRKVVAGGLTLILFVTAASALAFKGEGYGINVTLLCFAAFLLIQNFSLLLEGDARKVRTE